MVMPQVYTGPIAGLVTSLPNKSPTVEESQSSPNGVNVTVALLWIIDE